VLLMLESPFLYQKHVAAYHFAHRASAFLQTALSDLLRGDSFYSFGLIA
jgi:hypothetical protein